MRCGTSAQKPPCCRRGEAGGKTKQESSKALGKKQQGCNDYATATTRSLDGKAATAQLAQLFEEGGGDGLHGGPLHPLGLAEDVAPIVEPALEPDWAVEDLDEVKIFRLALEELGSQAADAAERGEVISAGGDD